MVGGLGTGISLPQKKRFLPSLHDDKTMLPGETIIVTIKII